MARKAKSVWERLDETARPEVEKALARMGWKLTSWGNHYWAATRPHRYEGRDPYVEIAMNPYKLVAKCEDINRTLRPPREGES